MISNCAVPGLYRQQAGAFVHGFGVNDIHSLTTSLT